MFKDFEDYLQDRFLRENTCVLDDDMPGAFDDWLCQMSIDEWLFRGELYGKDCRIDQINRDEKIIRGVIKWYLKDLMIL